MCLSHYDASGKFIAGNMKSCCAEGGKVEAKINKEVRIETTNTNGEWEAIVTTTENNKVNTKIIEGTEAHVKAELDKFRK